MKVLVTGGAGFIGSHLVEALVKHGDEVIVIDNLSTGNIHNLDKIYSKIRFLQYSLSLNFVWENLDIEADAIIHLAALPRIGRSIDSPVETYQANVDATVSILELARKLKVKKFIFGSSSSVYGKVDVLPLAESYPDLRPQSPYAFQKLMGELLCRSYKQTYGINAVILRFFNVYGSRMPTEGAYKLVMPIWIEQIKQGKKLTIYGDGRQTRDFTYIDDVVRGIMATLYADIDIDLPINLCTNVETSINDLAKLFKHETEYVPNPRVNEEMRKVGANKWASQIIGWNPFTTIAEGVKLLKHEYGL